MRTEGSGRGIGGPARVASCVGALLFVVSCGGGDTSAPQPTPPPPTPQAPVAVRVTLDPEMVTVVAGDTVRVTARVLNDRAQPISGAAVTWTSSDPTIATVNATGLVTGLKEGNASLTAASGPVSTAAPVAVHSPDRAALMDIYAGTLGADWTDNANWSSEEAVGSWYGVTADANSRVTTLDLSENNLNGQLPANLGDMAFLTELILEGNEELSGPIPQSLSELGLQTLRYGGTMLCTVRDEGFRAWLNAIPARDGEFIACNEERSDLMKLYDAMGGKSWTNSDNWGTDAPLRTWHGIAVDSTTGRVTAINLNRNNLSGEIPPEITRFPHLQRLRLDHNRIDGEIPPYIGELTELRRMDVDGNNFRGGIPPEIGKLENLEILWMGGNQMSGPIPPELGNLAGIEEIHLYDARFDGSVPEEFGSLTELRRLNLRDNELDGPLPPELGGAKALVSLLLQRNDGLAGPLPENLTSLSGLRELIAEETGLCMPSTPAFRAWLAASLYKYRIERCDRVQQQAHYWAQLIQTIQSPWHPVPLVAGEGALLRVFVKSAARTTEKIPPVRATFFVDGVETHTVNIPAGSSAIPTWEHDAFEDLELSANAEIPADVIRPGLEMVVEVDPDGTLSAALHSPTRLPREGRAAIEVRDVPPFRVTLVPLVWTGDDRTDAVEFVSGAEPEDEIFWQTKHLLPIASFDIARHESVSVDSNNLYDLLADIQRLRVMEAGVGNWMGIIPTTAFARGIGSIPGGEDLGKESVVRLDPDLHSVAETIAHEFGHNFSLRHAGCGDPANVDPSFPSSGGYVDVWGFDPRDGEVVPPGRPDLMTYCDPTWVSDYHFSNAIRWRMQDTLEIDAERTPAATRVLLVSGGVSADGRIHLDPAFVIDAPPVVPRFAGPYTLSGRRADGTGLFSLSFEMVELADAGGGARFTVALPVQADWAAELASLSLSGPAGTVEMTEGSEPPLAILRDPGTGRVRAVFRDLPTGPLAHGAADARAPEPGLQILVSSGLPGAAAWRR
ncbi:Ig-like domain-containing protein [Candidatus Palauibacter sp.]|uniref:Ig-like domain-containing protein n=1 Tax=Candidatus Palauibacter sp. TaxID=3101350 RepID=UPI003D0D7ABC